ncbi:MAG: hypothetical protein IJU12_03455, partial [Clostridia bacterium]|nr:hypothetical protein [Clostridia bacterium]
MNTTTNNLRLKLESRQESFRAKEKPMASQKTNPFIFWSVQRFFAVRFAHSMPAKLAAWKRWTAVSELLREAAFLSKSRCIRRSRVQGGAPLPGGVWGKA